jgi:hypothetical protein
MDTAHCGVCEKQCGNNASCVNGVCRCSAAPAVGAAVCYMTACTDPINGAARVDCSGDGTLCLDRNNNILRLSP